MRTKISEYYDIFRKVLLDNKDVVSDQNFLDFIERNELLTQATNDSDLIKLALISSHAEWEGLYRYNIFESAHIIRRDFPKDELVLGSVASQLTDEGKIYFKISSHELGLLRKEVIYQDESYKSMLDKLNSLEETYSNEPSYMILRNLTEAYIALERIDKFKEYLDKIKKQIPNNEIASYDYIMLASNQIYEDFLSIDELKEILILFENNADKNRILGIYNPVAYMNNWIKTIYFYLGKVDNNLKNQDRSGCLIHPEEFANDFEHILSDEEGLNYKENLELIKKHDELILELIPLSVNPSTYYPILKSTKVLIDHMLLNMNFPDKFNYFISFDFAKSIFPSEHDLFPTRSRIVLERLLSEFPNEKHTILIEYSSTIASYDYHDSAVAELESIKDEVHEIEDSLRYKYFETLINSYIALGRLKDAFELTKKCIEDKVSLSFEIIIEDIDEAGGAEYARELSKTIGKQ